MPPALYIIKYTIILVLLDQLVKRLIIDFKLQYTQNTGIAFGIPLNKALLIIGSVILIAAVIIIAKKELNLAKEISRVSVSLILAGAFGNLIDRVFRGYVIDFISIWKWPNFNLADAFIVVGILLLIIFYKKCRIPSRDRG